MRQIVAVMMLDEQMKNSHYPAVRCTVQMMAVYRWYDDSRMDKTCSDSIVIGESNFTHGQNPVRFPDYYIS